MSKYTPPYRCKTANRRISQQYCHLNENDVETIWSRETYCLKLSSDRMKIRQSGVFARHEATNCPKNSVWRAPPECQYPHITRAPSGNSLPLWAAHGARRWHIAVVRECETHEQRREQSYPAWDADWNLSSPQSPCGMTGSWTNSSLPYWEVVMVWLFRCRRQYGPDLVDAVVRIVQDSGSLPTVIRPWL